MSGRRLSRKTEGEITANLKTFVHPAQMSKLKTPVSLCWA